MNIADLTPGTVVRVIRNTPEGKVKFIKTGTVGDVIRSDYFEFTENIHSSNPGRRVYLSSDALLGQSMKGWTQHTEVVSR